MSVTRGEPEELEPAERVAPAIAEPVRHPAESALLQARAQLELALAAAQIGTWSIDLVRAVARADTRNLELRFKRSPEEELQSADWRENVHPDDRSRIDAALSDALLDRRSWTEVELRLPAADGSWHWCLARGRVTDRLHDGSPARLDGILLDVDRRRQAEQALAASERRYRSVAALTPGFVYEFRGDVAGAWRLTWISEGAREVFGCGPEEIIARGLQHFSAQDDAPLLAERIRRYRLGESVRFETPLRDTAGRTHWLRVASRPVHDGEGGQLTGIVGVAHDITEEKRLQQEILDISHREQQRIGNDLHDGLGQELTGASMLLREITRRLATESPQMAARIDDVIGLLNDAIESARLLARGLAPIGLVGGSLTDALRELGQTAGVRLGVRISVRNSSPAALDVDDQTALHLYRIAQEAISNAVRHGRARRIRITLGSNRLKHRMSISDDGTGMAAAPAQTPPHRGMGLQIMRYRASLIGGSIAIRDGRRSGVLLRCTYATRSGQS